MTQIRECTQLLRTCAKSLEFPLFLVGHVNKDGAIAGPKVMEHMVATVLYFEGERHLAFRILRAVKNRFGSTNEIGVFKMGTMGLAEVGNPSFEMISGDVYTSQVLANIELIQKNNISGQLNMFDDLVMDTISRYQLPKREEFDPSVLLNMEK